MTYEAKDVKTFSAPRWDYIYKWEELLDTKTAPSWWLRGLSIMVVVLVLWPKLLLGKTRFIFI
jgi:hypothetical protein